MENENHRPQIETLAGPYEEIATSTQRETRATSLSVRKVYGKDRIRYLRCGECAREFSERKRTPPSSTRK
jgi:hypothetical protein